MTQFKTFEDKLIEKYWSENPGTLFMEIEVGDIEGGRKSETLQSRVKKDLFRR